MKKSPARLGALVLSTAIVAIAPVLLPLTGASRAVAEEQPFIRGDANQDGVVSLSDMIYIRRWLFGDAAWPDCVDAADVTDNEIVSICDMVTLLNAFLMMPWDFAIPGPFPEPGPDPTPPLPPGDVRVGCTEGGPADPVDALGCESYVIQPAEETDDVVTLGDVVASPGEEIRIPVYLTNAVPVDAVQLVVEYDPMILRLERYPDSLSYEGAFYEQFFGRDYSITYHDGHATSNFRYGDQPWISSVNAFPEDGIFVVGVAGHIAHDGFEIPPGEDTLIAWIRATVSPDAPPHTVISLRPTNGPDGQGLGPYRMRNELTFQGDARYFSLIPQGEPGVLRVGIVGDITFFIRGDANRDEVVDVSDASSILGYLFLGEESSTCRDAMDVDDSGTLEITDAIMLLSHLFLGGEAPPPPFPEPGLDPTLDSVGGCLE